MREINRREFLEIIQQSAKGALTVKAMAELGKLGLQGFIENGIKFNYTGKDPETKAEIPTHYDPFCVTDFAGSIYPLFYPNRHYMGHLKFMMKTGEHPLVNNTTKAYVVKLNDYKHNLENDIVEQSKIQRENLLKLYSSENLDPTTLNIFSASLGISSVATALVNIYETSAQFRRIRGIKGQYDSSSINELIRLYEKYISINMPSTPEKLVDTIGKENDGWDKPRHLISHMFLTYTYMFGACYDRPFAQAIPPVLTSMENNPELLAASLSSLAGASYEVTSTFKDSTSGLNDPKYVFDIAANNYGRDTGI